MEKQLVRNFTIRNTEDWDYYSVYWNVELKNWVLLSAATIYNTYGEAKFVADRVGGFVAPTHTD